MNLSKILKYMLIIICFVMVGAAFYFAYVQSKKSNTVSLPIDNTSETPNEDNSNTVDAEMSAEERKFLSNLKLPEGFKINIYAQKLGQARVLAYDSNGTIYVSIPDQGKIVALPDKNKDGRADQSYTILSGLKQPHGLTLFCPRDFPNCYLYVAETDKVSRWEIDINSYRLGTQEELFDLPGGGGHSTRSLKLVNYDGNVALLTAVGSSCNVCNESDPKRATILISDNDGKNLRTFATGLRNSVFITQDIRDNKIYATDMGRDNLGDNVPPEEVNIIEDGKFYGWPNCYADNVLDTSFDNSSAAAAKCQTATAPYAKMQAHSAPLGIEIIDDATFGSNMQNKMLVAFHGSWNRTTPTGYKLIQIPMNSNGTSGQATDFISGWLTADGTVIDRPVDVKIMGDEIYISGDKEGIIYRVTKE